MTCDENSTVLLTIPYDEGWSLKVDGEPVTIDKTLGVFMSFDVDAGSHTFDMIYVPVGFNTGLLISNIAFFAILMFSLIKLISEIRKQNEDAVAKAI